MGSIYDLRRVIYTPVEDEGRLVKRFNLDWGAPAFAVDALNRRLKGYSRHLFEQDRPDLAGQRQRPEMAPEI